MKKTQKDYARTYYLKHKEEVKAKSRLYHRTHLSKVRAWHRLYYILNKKAIKKRSRLYALANKKRRRIADAKWRTRNRESIRKKRSDWIKVNYKKVSHRLLAGNAIRYAVRSGIVHRPTVCEQCHRRCKPSAHHHLGYSKKHRLHVMWLCDDCHHLQHH